MKNHWNFIFRKHIEKNTIFAPVNFEFLTKQNSPSEHEWADESKVLLRLKEGDESAFRWIYDRYSRLMLSNITHLVGTAAVAEDLLQDVFVKIWEHRATIQPMLSFKAYLFTISRHFSYNFKRRLQLEIETTLRMARDWQEADESLPTASKQAEQDALLNQVLNLLPEQRQRIYRLCKLDGLTYKEVAELLGISAATVRDHIVKANRFLKEYLTDSNASLIIAFLLTTHMN